MTEQIVQLTPVSGSLYPPVFIALTNKGNLWRGVMSAPAAPAAAMDWVAMNVPVPLAGPRRPAAPPAATVDPQTTWPPVEDERI